MTIRTVTDVAVERRTRSLLHKSQSNDSALHLSCRACSDGLRSHYFYSVPSIKVPHHFWQQCAGCKNVDMNSKCSLINEPQWDVWRPGDPCAPFKISRNLFLKIRLILSDCNCV